MLCARLMPGFPTLMTTLKKNKAGNFPVYHSCSLSHWKACTHHKNLSWDKAWRLISWRAQSLNTNLTHFTRTLNIPFNRKCKGFMKHPLKKSTPFTLLSAYLFLLHVWQAMLLNSDIYNSPQIHSKQYWIVSSL